ncbi:alcohol dehydrogenase catalytic domain-containing protein [Siminovitchia sp. 179-K 8D1 HS]|uniref:alcohol dehydrogenase catalytic domain-containing protein n=1 Tax=Siminovitchia sp. 179-K 8D1 HS TaxID=3142385 RepID=UPI0039A066C8
MLAIIKGKPGPGAEKVQVEIDEPRENEVLISIKIAAICGTDLHIYSWDPWAANTNLLVPGIIGHECVGEVVRVGKNVTSLSIGDRVCVETHIPCGDCRLCRTEKQNICENLRLFGLHTHGCFAQYAIVPSICARKIPSQIPDTIASVMEPLGVGVHAAQLAEVKGKRVTVLGAGPIGIFTACVTQALGAEAVYISDVKENRLKIASKCGNFKLWNPLKTHTSIVLNGDHRPDVIIETTGNERAIQEAIPYLRKGGQVILVGLFSNNISLNLSSDVLFKEATIMGIHGRKMWDTWDTMEDLLIHDKINIAPTITHHLSLNDFAKGFEIAQSGEGVKVLLSP